MIDQTVTVGNIIEIGVITIGGIVTFYQVKSRVESLGKDVSVMKEDVRALSKSFTELAVVNNKILNLENDVRELRHGRGFVREALDGEWPRRP